MDIDNNEKGQMRRRREQMSWQECAMVENSKAVKRICNSDGGMISVWLCVMVVCVQRLFVKTPICMLRELVKT